MTPKAYGSKGSPTVGLIDVNPSSVSKRSTVVPFFV